MQLKQLFWGMICLGLIVSFARITTREEPLGLAENYNDQVVQYYQQGQFKKALPLAEEAFKIRTKVLGERHPDTLTGLNNLAGIYQALGRLTEALPLSETGYRLSQEVLGATHPDTLTGLNNLAGIYHALGRNEEALPLYETGYRLSQKVLGATHPNTLTGLNNLASIYHALGRNEEALPLYETGYRLRTEALGATHPNTLTSLNNLAVIYKAVGSLTEALPLYETGYRLRTEALGATHPDTLSSLNNLAGIYQAVGRLTEALPLYETGYRLSEEVLGATHPNTLTSLNNLAVIYRAVGRLEDALPLYETGYRRFQKVLGATHPNTLISLNNLAVIYRAVGRLEDALPLYETGYRRFQKVLGATHPDTLAGLNNLAGIYQAVGRLTEALPLYETGYRHFTEVLGAKHPDTLSSLNNLAFIYQALGSLTEALPLYETGYRLRTEVLGAKHPDTLTSLNNLAGIYESLGRLTEALPLYETGYRLRTEELGAKHPDTLSSLNNLAYVYAKQGDFDNAIEYFEQLIKEVEHLRQRGNLSAENRQARFKQWIPGYFNLSWLYLVKERYNNAFQTAEKTKARTLLEAITLKLAAQQALKPTERQQFQQYQTRVAAFNERIAKENELDKRLALEMEKNQLVTEAATFHRRLMQQYPRYAQLNDVQIVDAEAGASLIPEDALFISYLLGDNQVLVFTLDTTGNLQAKDLGEIPNLAQTLKTYSELLGKQCTVEELGGCEGKYVLRLKDGSFVIKDELTRREKRQRINSLDEISRYLGEKLLEPVKERLAGKKHLIISPDGALALIPFEALILHTPKSPLQKGLPVIATHQVSYVQSLSVLALLKKREKLYQSLKNRGTLLAMGAARYEQPGQSIERNKCNKARRMPNYDLETMLSRNVADPKRYQRAFDALDIPWCNLPGTKKELNEVERIFAETQPLIFRDKQATEAKLQSLNDEGILSRYRYLLFSAHGYLRMDVPALSAVVLDQLSTTTEADGYVTASEWPRYNLKSDLMVLSACQTGVGKVVQGEGIMGLPYALYVAGNKNTLLTLWSVLDDSTATFTGRFFENLQGGMGQIEALTATKREFLNSEKHKRPLYWAPFVLYGI